MKHKRKSHAGKMKHKRKLHKKKMKHKIKSHMRKMKRKKQGMHHKAVKRRIMRLNIGKIRKEISREKIAQERMGCYYLKVVSKHLPFCVKNNDFESIEKSELALQDFMAIIERNFDALWYIGPDFIGNELFERFIFHHGGLIEASLNGKIRCFLKEDKSVKMEEALLHAVEKMTNTNKAKLIKRSIKSGKRLISLRDSIYKEVIK